MARKFKNLTCTIHIYYQENNRAQSPSCKSAIEGDFYTD